MPKLTEQEAGAIEQRLQVVAINVNEQMVSMLVGGCLRRTNDVDTKSALNLLVSFTSMLITLGVDVETLLEDRSRLLQELELYRDVQEAANKHE